MKALSPEVRALASRVDITEVLTTGTLARRTAGVAPPSSGENFDVELGVRVGAVREGEGFAVVAAVSVKVRRRNERRPFARFVQRFNVRYTGRGDATDEVLIEFAQTNGMVHLWPYARAFVQTASASLGLAPIVLPVFRVAAPNGTPLQASPQE